MKREHHYKTTITWSGNLGSGTSDSAHYSRNHTISIANKPTILASSDSVFRGDASRHNPEDFFLSSLSACHMLWYLHLCADNGIIVTNYIYYAEGIMGEYENGGGKFNEVTLKPTITLTNKNDVDKATMLHIEANKKCFIANSCNFPVKHHPTFIIK